MYVGVPMKVCSLLDDTVLKSSKILSSHDLLLLKMDHFKSFLSCVIIFDSHPTVTFGSFDLERKLMILHRNHAVKPDWSLLDSVRHAYRKNSFLTCNSNDIRFSTTIAQINSTVLIIQVWCQRVTITYWAQTSLKTWLKVAVQHSTFTSIQIRFSNSF